MSVLRQNGSDVFEEPHESSVHALRNCAFCKLLTSSRSDAVLVQVKELTGIFPHYPFKDFHELLLVDVSVVQVLLQQSVVQFIDEFHVLQTDFMSIFVQNFVLILLRYEFALCVHCEVVKRLRLPCETEFLSQLSQLLQSSLLHQVVGKKVGLNHQRANQKFNIESFLCQSIVLHFQLPPLFTKSLDRCAVFLDLRVFINADGVAFYTFVVPFFL